MATPGIRRATPEGTRRFAERAAAAPGFFRPWRGHVLSSLGLGSYLGDVGDAENRAYEEAALAALEAGVNVLDTAINYRNQQSERDLGRALQRFGRRDELVVATKGGFLARDAAVPGPARDYIRRTYLESGILSPDDVSGGSHSMAPRYLSDQVARSLRNLQLDAVDVYFVHNPESQLNQGLARDVWEARLRDAFSELERQCDAGRVGVYGVATWDGLRNDADHPGHVSLERLLALAGEARQAVGGPASGHHFGAIELPVNVAMPEAQTSTNQEWHGERRSVLSIAKEADLLVLASASLLQGRLVGHLPPYVRQVLGAANDVEAALEFARSCDGVTTALVGMGNPDHARANAAAMRARAPKPGAVAALLKG